MEEIRSLSSKPVSTTEPVDWLLSEPKIAQCSSFLTANAHPFFSGQTQPKEAVEWTTQSWQAARKKYPNKDLLFKEVGLPTNGATGLSELAQLEYYKNLANTSVVFSYFEAFDATARFKSDLIEQSWGLWTHDRRPKAIVAVLPWRLVTK
jgi:exo-beta-1,3-glucanase (GH17 family)